MYTLQRKIDDFCRKRPSFGIPNLMLTLLVGSAVIFFMDVFSRGYVSSMLLFDASAILRGQIWRLVTFIFVPTTSYTNLLGFAITTVFYYFIGTTLERHWGTAKFNLFILFGAVLTAIAGLVAGYASMYYVFFSMFFTIALLYPDMTIYLMFIIPFKAKWVAWINGGIFLYEIIMAITHGMPTAALLPIAALLNYFLLFSGDISHYVSRSVKQTRAKAKHQQKTVDFKSAQQHAKEKKGYLHKCAVCGKTDVTNPELEFRYCSKCNGYYCYCSEHINAHVHVE